MISRDYNDGELEYQKVYSESHAHWAKVFNDIIDSFYSDVTADIIDLVDKEIVFSSKQDDDQTPIQRHAFFRGYIQSMHEIKKIIKKQIEIKKQIYDVKNGGLN